MSGKKRKLPTVKDEVFEDEIGNDDFMTKQFDDEGNSDSEYSISEGEEETEIPEDDSEDESDDEPDDKSAERGKSKQVNQKAPGSKGAPKSKNAGRKIEMEAAEAEEDEDEGEDSEEEDSDEENWHDMSSDEYESAEEGSDIDSEDGEWETESESEEREWEEGSNTSKNGKDSGVESDIAGEVKVVDKELKKRTSVKKVLARIRSLAEGENNSEASTSGTNALKKKEEKEEEEAVEKAVYNEYEEDSSDEEDLRNTIGNIPMNWYDEYPHMGYDLDGNPIIKPDKGDKLDQFLRMLEDPDHGRTVYDKQTGQEVRLSDADLDIVRRVLSNKVPDAKYNMYSKWIDHFTHEVMDMPLSGRPEHKRSFIPSKKEAAYVARRAELIKKGMVTYKTKQKKKRFYDLWGTKGDDQIRRLTHRLETPKMPLPGHEDSYRAPLEYIKEYNARRFTSVRKIPQFYNFVKDRYERCLDLYLAPRKLIKKPLYKADDLLPRMPKPKDLRPFPTREALRFVGHQSVVRTISIHPLGKFLASGSDDHTVKIWEISTGRCLRTFNFQGIIKWVAWNPSPKLFLLAVVVGNKVFCLNPETYLTDRVVVRQTNAVFRVEPDKGDDQIGKQFERVRTAVTWRKPDATEWSNGIRVVLEHFKDVKQIVWHKQGDYFVTVIPHGMNRSILIHQLSRWRSQIPFTAIKARIEVAEFHPKLPFLYVVTQTHVRVYNLQKQTMLKNIRANSRWVSSISVHPGGEHFLIGTFDRKVSWFEMECTRKPHNLKYHKEAVRKVAFHRKYPLFASASDDGRIIVSHGMVYNDWITDPLIVPVKELAGHWFLKNLCVLDIAWHPYEPFVLSSGADTTIRLWS